MNKEYRKDDESGWGLKLKLNPLGAIMAQASLRKVPEVNALRKHHFLSLSERLLDRPLFDMPAGSEDTERTYYTFKFILKKGYIPYRNLFVDRLIRQGLDVSVSSFRPLHVLNITQNYAHMEHASASFPNADRYQSRVISLPAFTYERRSMPFLISC